MEDQSVVKVLKLRAATDTACLTQHVSFLAINRITFAAAVKFNVCTHKDALADIKQRPTSAVSNGAARKPAVLKCSTLEKE
jgi:hypothetical protein